MNATIENPVHITQDQAVAMLRIIKSGGTNADLSAFLAKAVAKNLEDPSIPKLQLSPSAKRAVEASARKAAKDHVERMRFLEMEGIMRAVADTGARAAEVRKTKS